MGAGIFQLSIALIIAIGAMILLTRYLNLHSFFSLLAAAVTFGLLIGKPIIEILGAMQTGFGALLQQIGLLVAIGSCLGITIEKTGAMHVISNRIINLFGKQQAVLSMTCVGVLVGIPVFCDSGFIILSRLIPSIASQTSALPGQLSLSLSSGLYTTHVLVPPTPGPLAAAANLNLGENISQLILITLVASIPVAAVSFYLSKRLGKQVSTEITPTMVDTTLPDPQAWKAFLPLLLPIVLIAVASLPQLISMPTTVTNTLKLIGNPIIALLIGFLFSFMLVSKMQKQDWPHWISHALKDAGVILLITGAGGAFGAVLKTSGIDLILSKYVHESGSSGILFLMIAFVIAAILKTAQGSSTSAIIITSSLLDPLAASAGFVSAAQLSVLIVAIGGGAMTVSHANDSYFWVVSQFGNIKSNQAYKSFTLITFAQGITALLSSIILFFIV